MSTRVVPNALITGFVVVLAATAVAQDRDDRSEPSRKPFYGTLGSPLISMVARHPVQTELQLDESASQKLLQSLREIDPTHLALGTADERQQRFASTKTMLEQTQRKSEVAIQESLSEAQFRRFRQLERQYLGGQALLIPETALELELSPGQQEMLKTIDRDFRAGNSPRRGDPATNVPRPGDEQFSARLEKVKTDLLAVLTPQQTDQWNQMVGAPFTFPKSFGGTSWRLILMPELHKELGLSEVDAATLTQTLETIRKQVSRESGPFRSNRDAISPADRVRQSQQIIDTVQSSLTIPQWNRLQELILQERGAESLANAEVAKELSLSPEQRDRVREMMREHLRGRMNDPTLLAKPEELRAREQKHQVDLLDILTSDQKERWTSMQGTKADQRLLRGF